MRGFECFWLWGILPFELFIYIYIIYTPQNQHDNRKTTSPIKKNGDFPLSY